MSTERGKSLSFIIDSSSRSNAISEIKISKFRHGVLLCYILVLFS